MLEGEIAPNGPALARAHVPAEAMAEAIRSEGLPVEISEDAGDYLCNYVFYRLLTELAATPSGPSAAFLHIPPVAAAGLTLDDLERGTKTAAAAFAPSSP
jgi:pyroglutamyl-peptidase